MDMTQILNDRATAQAEFMGETLNFTYRPGMITPNTYAKLTSDQTVDELAEFLVGAIVKWDLTQNGEVLDVTTDIVLQLPMGLIRSISAGLMADIPQRDVGKDSTG